MHHLSLSIAFFVSQYYFVDIMRVSFPDVSLSLPFPFYLVYIYNIFQRMSILLQLAGFILIVRNM